MIDTQQTAGDTDRVTVLAEEFTPAAMEYHRREMGRKGYRLAGPIVPATFSVIEGLGERTPLLGGKPYYAASFVRDTAQQAAPTGKS